MRFLQSVVIPLLAVGAAAKSNLRQHDDVAIDTAGTAENADNFDKIDKVDASEDVGAGGVCFIPRFCKGLG